MKALLTRSCTILAVCGGLFAAAAAYAQTVKTDIVLLVLPAEGSGMGTADGAIVTNVQQDSSPCPNQYPGVVRQNAVVIKGSNKGTGALKGVWRVTQNGEPIGLAEPAGTKFCTCQEFVNEPCSGGTATSINRLVVRPQSSPNEWVDCNNNGLLDTGDCQ